MSWSIRSLVLLAIVIIVFSGNTGRAESRVWDRLQQLPPCVGENKRLTMPTDEDWTAVGIREHVAYEQLHRANPGGFGAGTVVVIPGRHLPEPLLSDGLVINLPELMVYRWSGGRVVDWYPISIGRITNPWHTPRGKLHVISRIINPTWQIPDWGGGGIVPPGPQNPLGNRWVGLSVETYGLHGTNDPTTIGRMVSHGCIRLFPQHILDLFDKSWIGMPVSITYQTILVGQQNHVVYLAVFPDIYANGANAPDQVAARLSAYGLRDFAASSDVQAQLAHPDGVARPILGSDVAVRVNGTPLSKMIGPTVRDGNSYLPVRDMAKALGIRVHWDNAAKQIEVTRGSHQLTLPLDGQSGFTAFGEPFVQVNTLITGLGGTVTHSDSELNIVLE